MPPKPESANFSPILEKVAAVVQPLNKKIEKNDEHALLVIAVAVNIPDSESITTYALATGLFDVISSGLRAELAHQLENGHPGLFQVFQQVIHALEAEFNIAADDRVHLH